MTRPYCQYRPLSANSGAMYTMNFCDEAIELATGLSGSTGACDIMPRFWLCRIVRNVVQALMSTEKRMTPRTDHGAGGCMNRNLSDSSTPKTFAFWALASTAGVSPY